VTWVWSELLTRKQQESRRERLAEAIRELEALDQRLQGPRPRRRTRSQIQERVWWILRRLKVKRYLGVDVWEEQVHRFRQVKRGRPGPETRYRRETKRRLRLRWRVDEDKVAYDQNSDGCYPLLTNDRQLTPAQVLQGHKGQPQIEKRFEQLKTVMRIAPVFLKNEGRIEAFFLVYYFALLVQALIERELRLAMERDRIPELPLYPEERSCRRPTSEQILRLFALAERHTLIKGKRIVQVFEPALTGLQRQVLALLGVSERAYTGRD